MNKILAAAYMKMAMKTQDRLFRHGDAEAIRSHQLTIEQLQKILQSPDN
jgi:hypothetical protein